MRRKGSGIERRFVVVSGVPGSGKTTLARLLAPALGLTLLDKDAILERLFESRGRGDAAWRRALSRESDSIFQAEALASGGAVLVSHWHLPGMPEDSGTPTGWLRELNAVQIHCVCDSEVAARRFVERTRHAGHRDGSRSYVEILESICAVASCGPLNLGRRVDVDTSQRLDLERLIPEIHSLIG